MKSGRLLNISTQRCSIPMVAAQASCLMLDIVVTGTVQDGW
jgi:hypothetical protein